MKVTIGTAPDSWGVWFPDDPRQMPWQRFLDEVTEAGYKWIELGPYGYLPTDLSVLRRELDKRDLKVSGSFITDDLANPAGGPKLERELRGLGPTLKGLGAASWR
jgi:inosose dehydratase